MSAIAICPCCERRSTEGLALKRVFIAGFCCVDGCSETVYIDPGLNTGRRTGINVYTAPRETAYNIPPQAPTTYSYNWQRSSPRPATPPRSGSAPHRSGHSSPPRPGTAPGRGAAPTRSPPRPGAAPPQSQPASGRGYQGVGGPQRNNGRQGHPPRHAPYGKPFTNPYTDQQCKTSLDKFCGVLKKHELTPCIGKTDQKDSYRKALLETHPDRGGDAKKFRDVNAAWNSHVNQGCKYKQG